MKYQELVEKFEQQQILKDSEFENVKLTIKQKFIENEQVIKDLRSQLAEAQD